MYKKILNILLIIITIIGIISFDALDVFDTFVYLIPLLLSVCVIMIIKAKDIKKFKSIYNIIMLLLIIFSVIFLAFYLYSDITCLISTSCMINYEVNGLIYLFMILYIMLFINILDIKNKDNKKYNILLYLITIIVFIIYGRYYFDNDFYHNNLSKNIEEGYIYITQNYIYFNIMYTCLLIYYFINRKKN